MLADVEAVVARAVERFGRLDVLISNAGVLAPNGRIHNLTTDDWERSFRVNVLGAVNGIRAAVPVMRAQQSGSIILTASVAGLTAWSHAAPYCATKAAVIQTREGRGGRVRARRDPRQLRVPRHVPLGDPRRVCRRRRSTRSRRSIRSGSATAADLVGAYSYLASDASRWTTGVGDRGRRRLRRAVAMRRRRPAAAARHELVRRARAPRAPHARQAARGASATTSSPTQRDGGRGRPRWRPGSRRAASAPATSSGCSRTTASSSWRRSSPPTTSARSPCRSTGGWRRRSCASSSSTPRPGRSCATTSSSTSPTRRPNELDGDLVRVCIVDRRAVDGWERFADLRRRRHRRRARHVGGRRHPPADVHVGHDGAPEGRDDHPRQPGVEELRAHHRVRLHRATTSASRAGRCTTSARSTSSPPR